MLLGLEAVENRNSRLLVFCPRCTHLLLLVCEMLWELLFSVPKCELLVISNQFKR